MAIKLNATYCKRLGLPGFSSHQFSVSVETELVSLDNVADEAGRLYQLLQTNVDGQILTTGFVPPTDYGLEPAGNPEDQSNQAANVANWQQGPAWKCSDKQRDLIRKLVDEHQLHKPDVEALARERFGKGVRQLNKVEASGLIDELIETHGGEGKRTTGNQRNGSAYSGRNGRSAA